MKKLLILAACAGQLAFGQIYNPPTLRTITKAGGLAADGGRSTNLTVSGSLNVTSAVNRTAATIGGTNAGAYAGVYQYVRTDPTNGIIASVDGTEEGALLYQVGGSDWCLNGFLDYAGVPDYHSTGTNWFNLLNEPVSITITGTPSYSVLPASMKKNGVEVATLQDITGSDENLMFLPLALYAVASNQCYVGLDNLTAADFRDYWWNLGLNGIQYDEAWVYTPASGASDFSLSVVRGNRQSGAVLSTSTIPVYVTTSAPASETNQINTVTNTSVSFVTDSFNGFGELRTFTTNFNALLLPFVLSAAVSSTQSIDRVTVEVRNVIYTDGDMGNRTNVQTAAVVATGSVSVATNLMTNVNVFVSLNKTVAAADITGNSMFVGFKAFIGTNLAGVGKVAGYASDYVVTNHQSHYFTGASWLQYSGDPRMGIGLLNITITNQVKFLGIGDSTTAGGEWVSLLSSNSAGRVITIGTNSGMGVNYQAKAGWTWSMFMTSTNSPFVSGGSLNMSNYFENIVATAPDYIAVHLGINDGWSKNSDLELGIAYSNAYPLITNFIGQVLAYSPTTRIGLATPILPAYEQNGFGVFSGAWETRWRTKRNQLLWGAYLQKDFSAFNTNRVSIIPLHTCVDTIHNYATASFSYNARNTNTVVRQNQTVHPALSGYQQMGDAVWAWLANKLE